MNSNLGKLLLPFLVLILFGCAKDSKDGLTDQEQTGQGYYSPRGNLVLSIERLENTVFSEVSAAPDDYCTHLCFAIYDMTGTRIRQTNQKSSDAHYGIVGFQLDSGSYQVLVLAHNGNKNPTMTNLAEIKFSNSTGYTDTYLYYDTIHIVLGDMSNVRQTLRPVLRRVVAKCRFVINDTIPDEVAEIKFQYSGGSGHLDAMSGLGVGNLMQEVAFSVQVGSSHTEYDVYTFLRDDEDTVQLTVKAIDIEGGIKMQQTFAVPMGRNRITWLVGNFFNTLEGDWIIIPNENIDSQWGGETFLTY